MSTRREFLKHSGAASLGAAALGASLTSACSQSQEQQGSRSSVSGGSAAMLASHPEHVAPATVDRLPLEWHKATVKRLQEKLGERGLDGILLTDRWNIIYFTGLFHTTTERPFACFIPTKELAVHWFYPGLDLEPVRSWWFTDGDYYYDFPHAEGGYPDQGKVTSGPAVDLLQWRLDGIAKRGFGDKKIGLSQPPSVETMKRMTQILPQAGFEDVSDLCVKNSLRVLMFFSFGKGALETQVDELYIIYYV